MTNDSGKSSDYRLDETKTILEGQKNSNKKRRSFLSFLLIEVYLCLLHHFSYVYCTESVLVYSTTSESLR